MIHEGRVQHLIEVINFFYHCCNLGLIVRLKDHNHFTFGGFGIDFCARQFFYCIAHPRKLLRNDMHDHARDMYF